MSRWSFLSGISLAQVSNLSVLSLPVSWHGLWRPEQYKPLKEAEVTSYISAIRETKRRRINSQTLQTSRSKVGVQPTPFGPLLSGRPILRSKAARARDISDSIDRALNREQARSSESIKILLLGGSEAGKSTLLKMMRLVWAEGFKAEERSQFRTVIQSIFCLLLK